MKRTKWVLAIALAAVMALGMATAAMAGTQDPSREESEAHIKFKAGQITINPNPDEGEVGFQPMALEFGERNIPIRAEVYVSDGDSRSDEGKVVAGSTVPLTPPTVGVLINDSRPKTASSPWIYQVKLDRFEPDNALNKPFDATLFLDNTVGFTNVDASKVGSELVIGGNRGQNNFQIPTDGTAITIMTATANLGTGSHGALWSNRDIYMQLGEGGTPTGFDVITDDIYTAKLTWMLQTQ